MEALETKKPGERQPCQTGEYVQRRLVPRALHSQIKKILEFTTIFSTTITFCENNCIFCLLLASLSIKFV